MKVIGKLKQKMRKLAAKFLAAIPTAGQPAWPAINGNLTAELVVFVAGVVPTPARKRNWRDWTAARLRERNARGVRVKNPKTGVQIAAMHDAWLAKRGA